jgi:hypothetical protein
MLEAGSSKRDSASRFGMWILLIGGSIALFFCWLWFAGVQNGRQITLTDGTRIELLGTSMGSEPFTTEKPWQKLARRWLPAWLTGWIPPAIQPWSLDDSASNSLHIHLLGINHPYSSSSKLPWEFLQLGDLRYSSGITTVSMQGPGGSNMTIYDIEVPIFPRRKADFPLHFLDAHAGEMGVLRLHNPIRGPFPLWRPGPMPQSITNGTGTLTLEGIKRVKSGDGNVLTPQYHFKSADPAWQHSEVKQSGFSDATGNVGDDLPPSESAWKVHAVLYRGRAEDFSTTERLVVATNTWFPMPLAQINGTFTLAVQCNVGAGQTHLERFMEGNTRYPVVLYLSNARPEDELKVVVEYDTGSGETDDAHTSHEEGSAGQTTSRLFYLDLTPPPGTKKFIPSILVNRPLTFDFLIDPKDIQSVAH